MAGGVRAAPWRLDEEVEQHGRVLGMGDEHVAPGAQAGEQRLADARGEHRAQGGVDGVAARAQSHRPGLRAERMPGGHDAERPSHRDLSPGHELRHVELAPGALLAHPADPRLTRGLAQGGRAALDGPGALAGALLLAPWRARRRHSPWPRR